MNNIVSRFNFAYAKFGRRPFFVITTTIVTMNMLYFSRKYVKQIMNHCREYFFPTPIIKNILTKSEEYVEERKKDFLPYYNNNNNTNNNNENITNEVYNRDLFKKAIEKEDNELEKVWRRRMLFEPTPRGNVYMYYDIFKLGFAYYSDVNSLPYSILNAVAMKYCKIFKCNDFFIDQNVITDKNKESPLIKILHMEEKKKKSGDGKQISKDILKDAPFIKLKKNKSKMTCGNKETDKKETEDKSKTNITNKFINKGKIYNMTVLNKPTKKTSENFTSPLLDNLSQEHDLQKTVMSYKEYKNLLDNITYG